VAAEQNAGCSRTDRHTLPLTTRSASWLAGARGAGQYMFAAPRASGQRFPDRDAISPLEQLKQLRAFGVEDHVSPGSPTPATKRRPAGRAPCCRAWHHHRKRLARTSGPDPHASIPTSTSLPSRRRPSCAGPLHMDGLHQRSDPDDYTSISSQHLEYRAGSQRFSSASAAPIRVVWRANLQPRDIRRLRQSTDSHPSRTKHVQRIATNPTMSGFTERGLANCQVP